MIACFLTNRFGILVLPFLPAFRSGLGELALVLTSSKLLLLLLLELLLVDTDFAFLLRAFLRTSVSRLISTSRYPSGLASRYLISSKSSSV